MNILLLAEPFGFGPAGSLLSCKKQLNSSNFRWKYAGANFTRTVIENENFEDILLLDDNFEIDNPELKEIIDWADVIISGTEFRIDKVLKDKNKILVIYDPLYWFWPAPPTIDHPNTFYVCHYFTDTNIKAMQKKYSDRLFFAHPPIYQNNNIIKNDEDNSSTVLINLCGLTNPTKTLDDYYSIILDSIAGLSPILPEKNIVVTGNKGKLKKIEHQYKNIFQIKSFSHVEMLDAISRARMILSAPGLNSCMECMSLERPVFFLPPQNNSQAYQLEIFQENNLTDRKMDWDSITNKNWDWQHKTPQHIFNKLQEAMCFFTNSKDAKNNLSNNLYHYLTSTDDELNSVTETQNRFFKNLYKTENSSFSEIFKSIVERKLQTTEIA